MKTWFILIAATCVLALAGCGDAEKEVTLSKGKEAWNFAREKTAQAWTALSAEAEKLSAESGRSALEAGREKAIKLQGQLAELEIRNPLETAQLHVARQQVEKLTAAMSLQDLQSQAEQQLATAREKGQVVADNAAEARAQLARIDSSYRDLVQRMDAVQKTYDDASQGLTAALERARALAAQ